MISSVGFDNLLFFMGIVELEGDRTNSGRVKVRAFGIHPPIDMPDGVPTDDLPWAIPLNGAYRASIQIPRKGDWVFGFFADGRDAQHPFLIGSIEGINLAAMNDSGEPTESGYLAPSTAAYDTYGKAPLHPFITAENREETPELLKASMKKKGIRTARIPKEDGTMRDGEGWDEIDPSQGHPNYRSVVLPARFGDSYIGISDDDEEENIVINHSSGTHIQIDSAGNIKIRSVADTQIISEDNSYEYTGGVKNETHENGWRVLIQDGAAILETNGDMHHIVHGDYNLNVAGRMAVTVGLGFELACARATIETTAEHFNVISAEKIKMLSKDVFSMESLDEFYITSQKNLYTYSVANTEIGALEHIDIRAEKTLDLTAVTGELDIYSGGPLRLSGNDVEICGEVTTNSNVNIPGNLNVGGTGNISGTLRSGTNIAPGHPIGSAPSYGGGSADCADAGELAPETPEDPVSPQVDRPVSQSFGSGLYQAGVYSAGAHTSSVSIGDGPQILDDLV